MNNNINITHIDEQPTKEQIGKSRKKTLAHEKLFKSMVLTLINYLMVLF